MSKVLENRLQRILLVIENGYTGNIETGEVFDNLGKLVTRKSSKGYIAIFKRHKDKIIQLQVHQFIYYLAHGTVVDEIDHINGIKNDNRISNLRSVTTQENAFNRIKTKGYYWNKLANKWRAYIKINSRQINLGCFIEEADARQAYLDAKEKYHIIE